MIILFITLLCVFNQWYAKAKNERIIIKILKIRKYNLVSKIDYANKLNYYQFLNIKLN